MSDEEKSVTTEKYSMGSNLLRLMEDPKHAQAFFAADFAAEEKGQILDKLLLDYAHTQFANSATREAIKRLVLLKYDEYDPKGIYSLNLNIELKQDLQPSVMNVVVHRRYAFDHEYVSINPESVKISDETHPSCTEYKGDCKYCALLAETKESPIPNRVLSLINSMMGDMNNIGDRLILSTFQPDSKFIEISNQKYCCQYKKWLAEQEYINHMNVTEGNNSEKPNS